MMATTTQFWWNWGANAAVAVATFGAVLVALYGPTIKESRNFRKDSVRPIIVFEVIAPYNLAIRNIGKGPALDIELRLSQVHQNGGLTNLRNLIEEDRERHLLNLAENENLELGGSNNIRAYALAQDPAWQWGHRDVFAVIATYYDIHRHPYYTAALVRTLPNGTERMLVLKSTKTAFFGSGNIEKLNMTDWFK
jgi:hypothetical protein